MAILDADKEGFLRSERSLIQTIGRASRNQNGQVLLYADKITDSMRNAMDETKRRRSIQEAYNEAHHMTPKTIIKPVRDAISVVQSVEHPEEVKMTNEIDFDSMSKAEKLEMVERLSEQMRNAAKKLDFEQAATLRDTILEIKSEID